MLNGKIYLLDLLNSAIVRDLISGQLIQVNAKKFIVCANTFNTPH